MTLIELNIAGLHFRRSTHSRRAVTRSWQRNCRALRLNVKNGQWTQRRGRQVPERSAA